MSLTHSNKVTKVYVRLVFLRIGEIDTLNEKYQAHALIESRWAVPIEKFFSTLSSTNQERLINGKSVSLEKYAETHWHPQLYIENALGDVKEQINYSAKIDRMENVVYVREYRIVKGLFWEKLELHHFPSDVQDLSISVTSMLFQNKVILLPDPDHLSGVNREAFIDQQEWSLYEHVDTEQRFVKEFLFRTNPINEEDDDDQQINGVDGHGHADERQHSVLTITCHAARQSQYFFWNGFSLILLITLVSFCAFGLPLQYVVNRLQVACTLLLTSISFRWTINRSLPTISYLTSLDKYGILCIFNLVAHSIWHSIISIVIYEQTADFRVPKHSTIVYLDRGAFAFFFALFILIHISMVAWFFLVPLKRRQQMKQKDVQYRAMILGNPTGKDHRSFSTTERTKGHDLQSNHRDLTII